ncbi:MAG: Panacea domain-containing protein [Paracoccaceae bacterium]|nr:Panacea domain-containing protein [Paracoccaceae bacterium]
MDRLEWLTFGNNTPASQERLGELVLYIAEKTEDYADFGSTKINKTLYYSDFENFRIRGKSITGAQYQRITHGPAPKHIVFVEGRLKEHGELRIDAQQMTHKRVALRKANTTIFKPSELALIDKHIERLNRQTSTEVSKESHDVRWNIVNDADLLPYEFAFLDDTYTSEDEAETNRLASEFEW